MATAAYPIDAAQTPRPFVLAGEDPAFEALLAALRQEHQPTGLTESFLVEELAQAQWKLQCIARSGAGSNDPALPPPDKLRRYEDSLRRNWYRALRELRVYQRERTRAMQAHARQEQAEADNRFIQMLEETTALPIFPLAAENHESAAPEPPPAAADHQSAAPEPPPAPPKPMPAHLQRELAAHKRRDPLFDPKNDASQMSKALRSWFEKQWAAARA
jgi:hypothetical protein